MGTKVILDRQELQDLSDYTTHDDYNYLISLIHQAQTRADEAYADAEAVRKIASTKSITFNSGGFKSAGTYTYELGSLLGITNPDAWNFSISLATLGAKTGTTGYGGGVPVATAAPYVTGSIVGHSASIVVHAQAISGYHATQSTLSFGVTASATLK